MEEDLSETSSLMHISFDSTINSHDEEPPIVAPNPLFKLDLSSCNRTPMRIAPTLSSDKKTPELRPQEDLKNLTLKLPFGGQPPGNVIPEEESEDEMIRSIFKGQKEESYQSPTMQLTAPDTHFIQNRQFEKTLEKELSLL